MKEKFKKPSDAAKANGFRNLKELSYYSNTSSATLRNWFKSKPKVFYSVIAAALDTKRENANDLRLISK